MYAIVNVMYGVPLALPGFDFQRSQELLDWMDDNEASDTDRVGVHRYYHGASDLEPAAWGVQLRKFDECAHHTEGVLQLGDISSLRKDTVDRAYKRLSAEDKALIEQFGPPRVFFLWSTS